MNMTEQRPRRGRPRPIETIRRDETILHLLRDNPDGMSRNDLSEMMSLDTVKTWLALDRLRKEGLVARKPGLKQPRPDEPGPVEPEISRADKDSLWIATKAT